VANFSFDSVVCTRLAMLIIASRTGKPPGRTTFQDWHRAGQVQRFSIGGSRDLFFWTNEIEDFSRTLSDRGWPRVRNSIRTQTAPGDSVRSAGEGGDA